MEKYLVLQGVMSIHGNGDLEIVGEFKTLREALEFFDEKIMDKKGWSKPFKHSILVTHIEHNGRLIRTYQTKL